MEKFQNKYRIQSIRMPKWDYSRGGKYYVTIVTKNRVCCFGNVVNGVMRLNEMGKIANDLWLQIPNHFENTFLDEFIVMPNHIHGIVVMKRGKWLNGNPNDLNIKNNNGHSLGNVETRHASSLHPVPNEHPVQNDSVSIHININSTHNDQPTNSVKNKKMPKSPGAGSLSVIIGSFKSACTKKIHELKLECKDEAGLVSPNKSCHASLFGWQSRFYDVIIRNDNALQQIRKYIQNNPRQWNKDEFH